MSNPYQTIAIEGNIGSGKTTLATALSKALDARLILEQFDENPFLPLFYQQKERYAFQVEMYFLAERYHQLSRNLLADIFQPYTVMDYLFSKSAIFSGINLQADEHDLFMNMFRIMERFMPTPDILIYLHLPVEGALKRISKRNRSFEQGIKAGYLEQIERAYFNYMKSEDRFPIVLIDLEKNNFQHDELKLSQTLERILDRPWPHGMSYFRGLD